MKNRLLILVLLITLMIPAAVFAESGIKVKVNGIPVDSDAGLIVQNGRTMLPVRSIPKIFGDEIKISNQGKKVFVEAEYITIEFAIGGKNVLIHRKFDVTGIPEKVNMDTPATLIKGSTYVPLRFVCQYLNAVISIDAKTNTIMITTKNKETQSSQAFVTYSAEDVQSIVLYNLAGNEVKKFSKDEIAKIIGYYNSSKISNDMYVQVIAGYSMKITMNSGKYVRITSYGSKTNIIATVKKENETGVYQDTQSYHLICPKIAEMLLNY